MKTGIKAQLSEFVLNGRRILTPEGIREASIWVRNGVIEKISPISEAPPEALDAGDKVVMPGLVDTHVHVNEPGRTEWEGFESATQAAAAGGVTTIMDMPLNSIPVTTSLAAFKTKLEAAKNKLWVDCGFWGGVIPGNIKELEPMAQAGAAGFKAFMIHSGIEDFPASSEADLREAMTVLARLGLPLLVHAELESTIKKGCSSGSGSPRFYENFLLSRPASWENQAVRLLAKLCKETGCRTHIVHLSSAAALDTIRKAKEEGLPLSAETCPHYLFFESKSIPDGATHFKCCPPIREPENREKLWQGLKEGLIDFIVSDHSPCSPELKLQKEGDFLKAWGGIASLQFTLPAVWTEAKKRGFKIEDIARWMSEKPAQFAGLKQKGKIAPGFDADLTIWDPEAEFSIEPSLIKHRHKITPYSGSRLSGQVLKSFVRGTVVYDNGSCLSKQGNVIH